MLDMIIKANGQSLRKTLAPNKQSEIRYKNREHENFTYGNDCDSVACHYTGIGGQEITH